MLLYGIVVSSGYGCPLEKSTPDKSSKRKERLSANSKLTGPWYEHYCYQDEASIIYLLVVEQVLPTAYGMTRCGL